MGKEEGQINGILAFITTDNSRYLGGAPLSLIASDEEEMLEIADDISEAFLGNILKLKSGDCLVIKK
ncbi:capping complex subunit for YIEGIA [Alteribacter populi]|uniref:capping complex subunit for YIEGIA n=1 Tax=Alteribacter populi TaxID=2011011 RepID=UPI000BBAB7C2|nr:hypothetical protein [Alteribacter populi]